MRPACLFALSLLAGAAPAQAAIQSIAIGNAVLGSHAGNLIANGGFETGASGNQGWTGNGPHTGIWPGGNGVAIPSWTASYPTGAYGWWGPVPFSAAACTEGANCVYFGNWLTTASQTPSFAANGVVTFPGPVTFTNDVPANQGQVDLSQTVALIAGATYLLDFWTSGEGTGGEPSGVFGLTIGAQSVFLETVAGSRRYYVTFVADAASLPITFTNWGHIAVPGDHATELVLDDVILNAVTVPEPGTLAILGAALIGLAGLRRRR
jgi:hypothetical protein